MLEELKSVFNTVYLRVIGVEYFFKNKRVEKQLIDFLKLIPEVAGEDWLYRFTIFQFSYYDGMKIRFDRIYLNWIYGPKALQRWEERTEAQVYYADKFELSLGIKKEFATIQINDYSNNERKRFQDMSRQLIHCDENLLFDKECQTCKNCELFKTCLNQ